MAIKGEPDPRNKRTPSTAKADNGAATITLAAESGRTHVLDKLTAGFEAAPAAAKLLTVSIGGTVKFQAYLDDAIPHHFDFDGLHGGENEAMVISLPASGTGGVEGYVNSLTR